MNLLALQEWDRFLSNIYYKKLDNIFSYDMVIPLKRVEKTLTITLTQQLHLNMRHQRHAGLTNSQIRLNQLVKMNLQIRKKTESLVSRFLATGKMEFSLIPSDFPRNRSRATLANVEVYFLADTSYQKSVPLTITLKGPFIQPFSHNSYKGFLETFIQREWEGYLVSRYPSVRTTYEVRPFSKGFWYLNPFCTWEIKADWSNIDISKIRGMMIRMYYHVSQKEPK
ncbi:MAG: hypothetical protein D6785_04450 [Planctomycetota bacterium]|nr:MAG: hypothetical protein D6785_04450 [Planctomycetota bacterium]